MAWLCRMLGHRPARGAGEERPGTVECRHIDGAITRREVKATFFEVRCSRCGEFVRMDVVVKGGT
jgi:formylmethanofuran dehydrogenase subunit E